VQNEGSSRNSIFRKKRESVQNWITQTENGPSCSLDLREAMKKTIEEAFSQLFCSVSATLRVILGRGDTAGPTSA
jgi:hypothetical protein